MTQELGPNQRQWIEALRSGSYQQGMESLQDSRGRFCCLGVACKVAQSNKKRIFTEDKLLRGTCLYEQEHVFRFVALRDTEGEPEGTSEQLEEYRNYAEGLSKFTLDDRPPSLIELNDAYKLTFEQIADVLERYPNLFFKEAK